MDPPPPEPVVEEVAPEPELKAAKPEPEPIVAPSEIYEEVMEVAVKPSLNLRTKPNTRGKILKRIPYGEAVTILDRFDDDTRTSSNQWYRVRYRGKIGYVNAYYLRGEGEDQVIPEKRKSTTRSRYKVRKKSRVKKHRHNRIKHAAPKKAQKEESYDDGYNADAEPSPR
ncbi:MAG TPA: SH3 domain-containing protein [Turneriella sp.]|nr:SH3 domain-containing protein [Turneriella sp.]